MSVAKALEAGIEEAQKRPHNKGTFVGSDGESVCMLGAVMAGMKAPIVHYKDLNEYGFGDLADPDQEVFNETWEYLDVFLEKKGLGRSVPGFNDELTTSKEDVVLTLKEALYNLESDEA
jgi:hypothetical protein